MHISNPIRDDNGGLEDCCFHGFGSRIPPKSGHRAHSRSARLKISSDCVLPAVHFRMAFRGFMKMQIAWFLTLLPVLLPADRVHAQDLRDPGFVEGAQEGFADIFNLDYDRAWLKFSALEREYPNHPAPALYLASILWLEEMLRRQDLSLNRFIAPTYFSGKTNIAMPPGQRESFFNYLLKSQELSRAILKKNPRDRDARYFIATASGLRASFAITIDHSLREAFRSGGRAYAATKKLIEEDPKYYDAYLTVGIYEYIAGSIPWYLKWMSFLIGVHGSVQDGLEHLKLASENGEYIRNEAELVLMVLNVREHRYAEALQIARHLNTSYPRSFIFALNAAQICQLSGQKEKALAMLLQIEKRIEAGEPNFDRYPLQNFRFDLGLDLMGMGQLDAAEDRFRKIIGDPQTQKRERTLSHLHLGRILDRKGRHTEAVKEYKTVLAMEDVENSHRQASQSLQRNR